MEHILRFGDDLGPARVIHVYQPSLALNAVLVIDNVACGPSIGGLRMAADGGGKSVIVGDPRMPAERKEQLIRALACALRNEHDYIFGPDMGTDETCMAWIKDEIGRSVGLPAAAGGIPLDEIGATGWGLRHAAEIAARHCDLELKGARVAIQGFGAVGKHAARFLADAGAVLVAASDTRGTVANPKGIDVAELIRLKDAGKSVCDYGDGSKLGRDAVIGVECDIWIPAARPDVVREDNVDQLKTRLVLQGANIPFTAGAEKVLHDRGVTVLPDFIANAGGVICAAMEFAGSTRSAVFAAIEEKIRANTAAVLSESRARQILPREAAFVIATRRVREAMRYRRWGIF